MAIQKLKPPTTSRRGSAPDHYRREVFLKNKKWRYKNMYLCKKDQEKLTVKNAKKVNVVFRTLDNYCKEYEKNTECDIKIKKDLEPGTYAKNIKIVL
jgi:hypothetical protein